jgi:hypothetical protein
MTGIVAPVYALDIDIVTGYLTIGIGSEVHIVQEISGSEPTNNLFMHPKHSTPEQIPSRHFQFSPNLLISLTCYPTAEFIRDLYIS